MTPAAIAGLIRSIPAESARCCFEEVWLRTRKRAQLGGSMYHVEGLGSGPPNRNKLFSPTYGYRVDTMGACRLPSETGFLIPSVHGMGKSAMALRGHRWGVQSDVLLAARALLPSIAISGIDLVSVRVHGGGIVP